MRTRLIVAAFVALGLALGYGIGYATWAAGVVSGAPLIAGSYASHDGFNGVFQGIEKLGFAEQTAESCSSSKEDPIALEDNAINAIQDRAGAASLNPPLDVARARLALRRAILAEKNNDSQQRAQYEEAARQLLQKSGWKDPSAAHLRQIVTELDTDGSTCSYSQAKGGLQN